MAAPLVDPLISKLQQTTSTLARATSILRSAFPAEPASGESVAVQLPRRDVPTYVLPNQGVQPWELLPMKAAAMAQYPNFFNHSCTFFGSIKRDVVNGVPFCLLRPTRLSIDMAKVVRNLGVVDGFELVQRRNRLGPHDFVWTSDQPEPADIYDVALFKHRLIRLHLRTDMFSLRPASGSDTSSVQPAAQLAPAFGLLPLSVKNISKASQPVLMYPRQLEQARLRLPSGIFVCYHHELGIITDALAEQYDVPTLVAAHVGLPLSQVAQIRGALRLKAQQEAGVPLRHVTPLKAWNMVQEVRRRAAERREALEARTADGAEGPIAAGRLLLQEAAKREQPQARRQLSDALEVAAEMEDGLLAWQLVRGGLLRRSEGSDGEREAPGEGGQPQPQPRAQQRPERPQRRERSERRR